MALIKCPECGKEISDKAVSCPSCGCPITTVNNVESQSSDVSKNESQTKNKLLPLLVLIPLVVVILVLGWAKLKNAFFKDDSKELLCGAWDTIEVSVDDDYYCPIDQLSENMALILRVDAESFYVDLEGTEGFDSQGTWEYDKENSTDDKKVYRLVVDEDNTMDGRIFVNENKDELFVTMHLSGGNAMYFKMKRKQAIRQ